METQFGVPPFKSLKCLIPVTFTIVSTNAGICGPPYISSGYVTCTGPVVPWYDAMEAAPLACCWALGAENVSAYITNQAQSSNARWESMLLPSSCMRRCHPSSTLRMPRPLQGAETTNHTAHLAHVSNVHH